MNRKTILKTGHDRHGTLKSKRFERLLNQPYESTSYLDMIESIDLHACEPNHTYWLQRYYWIYLMGNPEKEADLNGYIYTPMSEDDWSYLRSFLPKTDDFLIDPKNKEYIS